MKLSKTTLMALCVGIFVVLGGSLGLAYAGQGQKQGQLSTELASTQALLDKQTANFAKEGLPAKQKDLETRLTRAESGINDVRAKLRQIIQSIEVTDNLFKTAYASSVNITSVRSTPPGKEKLNGTSYDVLPLNVELEGEVSNMLTFILSWSEGHPTGVVESVNIDVPGPTANGTMPSPSATLKLVIYNLPEAE
ncbi:MAG: hypothetical protein Q8O05_06300 [Chloroflexota bacterium]|nr:hypothetical protein [Chloroflexota bacterium]